MRRIASKIARGTVAANPVTWVAVAVAAIVGAGVTIGTQTHIVQSMAALVMGAF